MKTILSLLIAISSISQGNPARAHFIKPIGEPYTTDHNSIFYQEFFDLPDSATTTDSLTALNLPPAHPMEPGHVLDETYIYITGRILDIEPITRERYPALYRSESNRRLPMMSHNVVVRIEITETLAGIPPDGIVEALSWVRTDQSRRVPPWKTPPLHRGAEIAGLLLYMQQLDSPLGDRPILHGSSIFIFSSPRIPDRLDDFRAIVIDLFRRSAEAMAEAQSH